DVTTVNDSPVAVNDSSSTTVNTAVTTGNVLANDSDVDGDTLTVVAGTPLATNGTVVNNGDGTFTYTPGLDFTGSDSFDYSVTDSVVTVSATVNVVVNPPGTPAVVSELLDPSIGGGIGGFESDIDEFFNANFEIWMDRYDPVTNSYGIYDRSYNSSTQAFEQYSTTQDYFLRSDGVWDAHLEPMPVATANDVDGSMVLRVQGSIDTEELGSFRITATTVDISGELMSAHVNTTWSDYFIDQNSTFGVGAQQVTSYTFESLALSYTISVENWCENEDPGRFAALNGNCNGVLIDAGTSTYASILSEVISATAWVDMDDWSDVGLVAIPMEYNGATNTELLAEVVSDGTVNYYKRDYNAANQADFMVLLQSDINAWVIDSTLKGGIETLRFTMPQLAGFPDVDSEAIFTVQNGAVRGVSANPAGKSYSETNVYNGIAIEQVLGNFSGPTGGGASACDYETPWDDINDQPAVFNSYNDFLDVVASCGGALPLTEADVVGTWLATWVDGTDGSTWTYGYEFYSGNTGVAIEHREGILMSQVDVVWSVISDATGDFLIVEDSFFNSFRDVFAKTGSGFKIYVEDSGLGSDLNTADPTTLDGYIWTSSMVKQGGLSCNYQTPWNDITGQPYFDSYNDFLQVIASCGGSQTMTEAGVTGTWVETWVDDFGNNWTATAIFNANGTGSFSESYVGGPAPELISFSWSIGTDGPGNSILNITDGINFQDVYISTSSGFRVYTEESGWGDLSILNPAAAEGEIWISDMVKQ
ncbi:MAG: Ig-like domain-containing protein, partial [Gammaproteobacteria bacterium]|nr:Ig-like domain-containing protein [Gammaproteobacteria bacterium]